MAHDAHPTGEGNAPGSLQQPGVMTRRASKEAPARPSTCPTALCSHLRGRYRPVKREAEDLYGTLTSQASDSHMLSNVAFGTTKRYTGYTLRSESVEPFNNILMIYLILQPRYK